MNIHPSRREFLSVALATMAAGVLRPREYPDPQVRKLAEWRSAPELKELERAFEFLRTGSVETKAPGRYQIDADRIYATVSQSGARSPESAQFEAHRKYIDLHYLISGKEMIGWARQTDLRQAKPYSADSEAGMYERPKEYRRLILSPGDFVVFFPGQAHMPTCQVDGPGELKKVVVKILAPPA
jgi:YhcH/YjgK/YiaL family protein